MTSLATGILLTTMVQTGLPTAILVMLSMVAAGFAAFDLIASRCWPNEYWPLATVGLLNLLYCLAVVAISCAHLSSITSMGVVYFTVECAIVIPIAAFELMVAGLCRPK